MPAAAQCARAPPARSDLSAYGGLGWHPRWEDIYRVFVDCYVDFLLAAYLGREATRKRGLIYWRRDALRAGVAIRMAGAVDVDGSPTPNVKQGLEDIPHQGRHDVPTGKSDQTSASISVETYSS